MRKYILLTLSLLWTTNTLRCQQIENAQVALSDSVTVVIPLKALNFRTISRSATGMLKNSKKHIACLAGRDSVYVFTHKAEGIGIAFGSDQSFDYAELPIHKLYRDKQTYAYHFYFDSLQQYLIVNWYESSRNQDHQYYGSEELYCNEKIRRYSVKRQGLTVVDIHNRTVLFTGILEIEEKEEEIRNPGRHEKVIRNESYHKAKFFPEEEALKVYPYYEGSDSSWGFYENIEPGVYIIKNRQFCLFKRY